jgi:hypothetical protein
MKILPPITPPLIFLLKVKKIAIEMGLFNNPLTSLLDVVLGYLVINVTT